MAWWDPPAEKRMPTLSGIKGAQIEAEIAEFIELLKERHVKNYLEIGGKYGDTFYRVMSSLPDDACGVLVDLPPNMNRQRRLEDNFKKMTALGNRVKLLIGNSHDLKIIQVVQQFGPYDAVFIDADRTYEGIKQDWETFGPMAELVAFHDIRAAGTHLAESVQGKAVSGPPDMMAPQLWKEIKESGFSAREIADKEEYVGIGVVFNNREVTLCSQRSA